MRDTSHRGEITRGFRGCGKTLFRGLQFPQRLKPRLILLHLRRGLKPRPFRTGSPFKFSRSLLRRGLHSFAASRLGRADWSVVFHWFHRLFRQKSPHLPKAGRCGAPAFSYSRAFSFASVFLLFFNLFTFSVCFGQTPSSPSSSAGKFRIAGTVVNANTGEIIRGATVTIGTAPTMEVLESTTSGGDGGFQFEGLKAGKYWMRAEATGFVLQGFEEHQGFFTGIVTGGAVDSEHLMFALRPDASIVGHVVDESNEAVRDAEVMLFKREVQEGREETNYFSNALVNDEGRYRFSHLAPGTYYIVVRATPWYAQQGGLGHIRRHMLILNQPGTLNDESNSTPENQEPTEAERALDLTYPVTYYPGATEESEAVPLVLKSGDRASADVRLVAVPAAHLHVRRPALDPNEQIAVNVTQRIFDGQPQGARVQNVQTEKGDYEVGGIAPGDYDIRIQSYGKSQMNWTQHVSIAGDQELVAGRAQNGTTVKGVVTVEGRGAGVMRGYMQLTNRMTGERFTGPLNEKGEFLIAAAPLMPGTYQVEAGTADEAEVVRVVATGAKVTGQNVEIGNGASVQLAITLREGLGNIDGTVMREGKPNPGAMVVLVPQDFKNNLPLVRRDQSDLDGTFTLRSVVPGKYTVVAIQHGWEMDWMNPTVMNGFVKSGTPVDVRADGKYAVTVQAQ